jgi:hypothetical protein
MTEIRWHVVAKDGAGDEERVWTISRFPDRTGWDVDNSTDCGLSRAEADELADAANFVHARKSSIRGWQETISSVMGGHPEENNIRDNLRRQRLLIAKQVESDYKKAIS